MITTANRKPINNKDLYQSLLSQRLNLDTNNIPYDDEDEVNNTFTIPINLISEEKMATRFMENIKALIRSSIEYKQWVKWFKQQYNPIMCAVSDNTQTIEVHHHPFTLEDYVDIAIAFLYNNGMTFTAPLISDMVMRWHYMNIVGACYMSKTYHMRFHEDHDIVIPEEAIYGNIDQFLIDPIISQHLNNHLLDKLANYCPQFYKNHINLIDSFK